MSDTTTHTPGPWKVASYSPATIDIVAPGVSRIAAVPQMFVSRNQHIANARLIAAAPAMLETLEALRDAKRLSTQDFRRCADRILDAAIRNAREDVTT